MSETAGFSHNATGDTIGSHIEGRVPDRELFLGGVGRCRGKPSPESSHRRTVSGATIRPSIRSGVNVPLGIVFSGEPTAGVQFNWVSPTDVSCGTQVSIQTAHRHPLVGDAPSGHDRLALFLSSVTRTPEDGFHAAKCRIGQGSKRSASRRQVVAPGYRNPWSRIACPGKFQLYLPFFRLLHSPL